MCMDYAAKLFCSCLRNRHILPVYYYIFLVPQKYCCYKQFTYALVLKNLWLASFVKSVHFQMLLVFIIGLFGVAKFSYHIILLHNVLHSFTNMCKKLSSVMIIWQCKCRHWASKFLADSSLICLELNCFVQNPCW